MSKSKSVRTLLISLLVCSPLARADGKLTDSPGTTQPTTQPAPEALKALADLAAHPKLLLTNDSTSAHPKFSYALAINPPAGGLGQPTTVLVVRDGDRMGVVVGAKGLPCYYMTEGLMIGVDPKNPGQLMMHEGGSVQLLFGGKDAGVHSGLSYTARHGQNSIVLDPAALLTSIVTKANRTDFRPDLHRLGIHTSTGDQLKIKMAALENESAYPIESLMMQAPAPLGMSFAFGNVTPNVVLKKSIAGRTATDARKLGIPIRQLSDEDLPKEYFALARKDFAENEEEQETAEKLRALFPDDAPGSEP